MDYFNKIPIILILFIVCFLLLMSIIKTNKELFYVDNINLKFSGGKSFLDLFKQNLQREKMIETSYFGEIPKKIAQEKYLNHLNKLKDGYYDYNNIFTNKDGNSKETNSASLSSNQITPVTTKSSDLKINFI